MGKTLILCGGVAGCLFAGMFLSAEAWIVQREALGFPLLKATRAAAE